MNGPALIGQARSNRSKTDYTGSENKRNDEFRRGITLIGSPDDISILLNKELDIRNFGSQGQQRTAALALKWQ